MRGVVSPASRLGISQIVSRCSTWPARCCPSGLKLIELSCGKRATTCGSCVRHRAVLPLPQPDFSL